MNVDVVIVTHNSAEHIEQCIRSLPRGVRPIVVDNASGDETRRRAADLGATVVANETNRGFGAACNQAIARSTAPAVLLLNPDAELEAGCFDDLVATLDATHDAAIVGPALRRPDGTEQRARWPFPSARQSWQEAIGLVSRDTNESEGFLVGACLLVRRSAFDEVGGFDERYWLYGEEADLTHRLRERGWRAVTAPHAVCTHVGGASGDDGDLVFEHFQRGTERFVLDHRGRAALVSHRAGLLVGSLVRALALTVRGQGRSDRAMVRRRIVERLLVVLATHPVTVPANRPSSAGSSIVVFSLEPWDEVWRRNQLLVDRLLVTDPDLRVLFIEPPVDVVHELRRRSMRWPVTGLRNGPLARLVLHRPIKVMPRMLGPLGDRLLLRSARRAMRRAGAERSTLWVNDPAYADVVSWGRPVVYDLTDDWTSADRPRRIRHRLSAWDAQLTAGADVVTACSTALSEGRGDADVRVIPNAVDADHFRGPRPRPADLPPPPCAVYVGTLHEDRLDVDLLLDTAAALPLASFVLVGPDALSRDSQRRLAAVDNVHLLGARPYSDIPGYLQHADAVIVPHVITAFTESLDPIKAYECLAVGRPTVATPVPGFIGATSPVVVADRSAFAAQVSEVLATQRPSVPAMTPSWDERAAAFRVALADAAMSRRHRFKVVYLDHCARLSGAELALTRLLPALDVQAHVILGERGPLVQLLEDAGATVEVFAIDGEARDVDRRQVTLRRLPMRSAIAAFAYSVRLSRRIRALEPDLVHTNSLKSALYGGVAGRLAGVPVLVHVRDRIADDYMPAQAVWLVRRLVHVLPRALIANSQATLSTVATRRGRGHIVASPVVYDVAGDADVTRSHEGAHEPFTFVMLGRLAPWKGQHVFVDAFASAFAEGSERALIVGSAMFGEDDYEQSIRQQIETLGLSGRVELAGFREDVTGVLEGADVVVHASTVPEPFGQVVVEAMASGVPVIASAAGGPSEVITDAVDGLLVAPGDVAALANSMRRLRNNPELRASLSAMGRKRARDFAPDRIGAEVMAVYRRMLGVELAPRAETASRHPSGGDRIDSPDFEGSRHSAVGAPPPVSACPPST